MRFTPVCYLLLAIGLFVSTTGLAGERPVRFNRDVRAVLSDKCFACHGPDSKTVEGGLRLDLPDSATEPGSAIVPGDPDSSELVRRILSVDPDEQMPPPASHKHLESDETDLLRRWIAEGAVYEPHWAYTPMRRETPPEVADTSLTSAIDRFIGARFDEENVDPVPQADRITLIRRLSFDLTGIPPAVDEVDAFVNDASDDAYEKLVQRLLNSDRYGERMAIYWLDLVRYADTVGYHGDQDVSQSPYRDYVINAFNDNMPYDRFVREQLAGDLLPGATIDQQIASGYNRLNQTTEEGGSQAKEYLAIYFADRVRNVSQVFMGATMGCAQCHDHKYDPYTTRDFYSMGAFFADLDEKGVYSARTRPPTIRVPSEELRKQLAALNQGIAQLDAKIEPLSNELVKRQDQWETEARSRIDEMKEVEFVCVDDQPPPHAKNTGKWKFVTSAKGQVRSGKRSRRQSSDGLVQHLFQDAEEKIEVDENTRFYAWVHLDPKNPPDAIMLQFNNGNWDHRAVWGTDDIRYGRKSKNWAGYRRVGALPALNEWIRLEVAAADVGLGEGSKVNGMAFTQFGGLAHWDKAGWIGNDGIPVAVADALIVTPTDRTLKQSKTVHDYYIDHAEPLVELRQQIANRVAERKQLEETAPMTVVSKSVKPRTVRILPRGNWMDDSGEIVTAAVPGFLGGLEIGGEQPTRLDLANWLCKEDNPLTSRTMVNRLWSLLFGRGICASVDDFGGQGTYPSHPDLLDWLAIEFVQSGWDIKHIVRAIVTSDAYRRSSKPTPDLRERDPYNEWFARQGRFRIDAEMVRDSALATSGLLVEKVGGRSVKPYQPAGYYAQLNFPKRTYAADEGEDQYRRGVYTHWQRTFLHPMLKAFDAPSREECTAARSRSNTPLQALALLNDPTFVEAARVFAARIVTEGGPTTDERIEWAYKNAVSRKPSISITTELRQLHDRHLQHYRTHVDDAKKLVSEGASPVTVDLDAAELAAWTSVARVIMNLHETITRY